MGRLEAALVRTGGRPWRALAAGGAALFLVSFVLVHLGPLARGQISDTWIYQRAGDAIVHHGQVPYRDFPLEYPPGALPTFVVPTLAEPVTYARSFQVEMFVCGLLAILAVVVALRAAGAEPHDASLALVVIGLSPLLAGPLVLSRFDLWPAALTAAAVAALARERDRTGAVFLGLAVATKLYAAALLPLAAIDVWRRRGPAAAARFCGLSAVVAGAIFLPFAIVAPSGVLEPVSRQVDRPLQVESLGSALLIAVHQLTGMHIRSYGLMGSDNLASPGAGALATAFSVVGLLGVGAVCVAYARGPGSRARLCLAAAAAVTILVAFAKVLSPQFMLWLVPLVPLAVGHRRGRLALVLLAAVLVLTQTWYPRHYAAMADRYQQPETWFLLARDLLLVVLAGTLAAALLHRRKPEAGRSVA
jgi:uncharacterized membrane protein